MGTSWNSSYVSITHCLHCSSGQTGVTGRRRRGRVASAWRQTSAPWTLMWNYTHHIWGCWTFEPRTGGTGLDPAELPNRSFSAVIGGLSSLLCSTGFRSWPPVRASNLSGRDVKCISSTAGVSAHSNSLRGAKIKVLTASWWWLLLKYGTLYLLSSVTLVVLHVSKADLRPHLFILAFNTLQHIWIHSFLCF